MMEILGKTKIDFMGKRNIAFTVSGILVALGLLAIVGILEGWANLGIDFAGGTAVQLKFDKPLLIAEARKALDAHGLGAAELQEFPQDRKLLIRLKTETTIEEEVSKNIIYAFQTEFPNHGFVVDFRPPLALRSGKNFRKMLLLRSSFPWQALYSMWPFGLSSALGCLRLLRRFMTSSRCWGFIFYWIRKLPC